MWPSQGTKGRPCSHSHQAQLSPSSQHALGALPHLPRAQCPPAPQGGLPSPAGITPYTRKAVGLEQDPGLQTGLESVSPKSESLQMGLSLEIRSFWWSRDAAVPGQEGPKPQPCPGEKKAHARESQGLQQPPGAGGQGGHLATAKGTMALPHLCRGREPSR